MKILDSAFQPSSTASGIVPEKGAHPRAWDHDERRYQWHFGAIPPKIRVNGVERDSPFRKVAIFVVHGVGEQVLTETAAGLRLGLEDAVARAEPRNWDAKAKDAWIVPQPFIFDGFWGNYAEFEEHAPDVAVNLKAVPLEYFKRVWKGRAVSLSKTLRWFLSTGHALIKQARGFDRLYYMFLVPMMLVIIAAMAILPKTRRIVRGYLNDVRLYVTPEGDVERAIVQRIDRRVAEMYLRLIGLSWKLDMLPSQNQLTIEGDPHSFESVVWVAHSLGTVISYNVIGDLLSLCSEKLKDDANHLGATRLEESLRAFVTLGSPLDKIAHLFQKANAQTAQKNAGDGGNAPVRENALRSWPDEYLPGGRRDLWANKPELWQNFYYTTDPVSGHLDAVPVQDDGSNGGAARPPVNTVPDQDEGSTGSATRPPVTNLYTKRASSFELRLPGVAHVKYWSDPYILNRIIELLYTGYVNKLTLPTVSKTVERWRLRIMSGVWLLLLFGVTVGLLWAGWRWIVETFGRFAG